uniref:Testis-specific serine/threonine-protein kinase 5-like n=1 Tax=Saccoglossus kowalevskii TaxID=10224 RepID=A0ABM0MNY9_SACKO|nr:PREDICTED: testis-specific serine/threonine-protein kinase 5-like [Saccoglossus kowalevskii]
MTIGDMQRFGRINANYSVMIVLYGLYLKLLNICLKLSTQVITMETMTEAENMLTGYEMVTPTIYRWPPKSMTVNPKSANEEGALGDNDTNEEIEEDDVWKRFACIVDDPKEYLHSPLKYKDLDPTRSLLHSGNSQYHFWVHDFCKLSVFPIGIGTYSRVYIFVQRKPLRKVALRMVDRDDAPHHYVEDGFYEEIRIMKKLRGHPHIIKYITWFEARVDQCLVTELAGRGSLERYISNTEDGISETQSSVFFMQIIDALSHCHDNNIAHGDVTTYNILLNEHYQIKLSDFKFSTEVKYQGCICAKYHGTYGFVPPEVIDRKPYDPIIADIWSLGCVLFKMISKRFPFSCQTDYNIDALRQLMTKAPQWPNSQRNYSKQLRRLIKSMLTINPKHRIDLDGISNCSWLNIATSVRRMELQPSKVPC